MIISDGKVCVVPGGLIRLLQDKTFPVKLFEIDPRTWIFPAFLCRAGAQWVPDGDNSDHIVLIERTVFQQRMAGGFVYDGKIKLSSKQMPDHLLSRFLVWDQLHVRIAGGKNRQCLRKKIKCSSGMDSETDRSGRATHVFLKLIFIMGFYFYHFFCMFQIDLSGLGWDKLFPDPVKKFCPGAFFKIS